jgi:hypothetical protein
LARRYDPITLALVEQIAAAGFDKIEVVDVSADEGVLIKTLREDAKSGIHSEEEALKDIYKRLRPGDPATSSNAKTLLKRLFFEPPLRPGKVGATRSPEARLAGKVSVDLRTLHESGVDVIGRSPAAGFTSARTSGRHRPPRQPPSPHGCGLLENQCRVASPHGAPDPRAMTLSIPRAAALAARLVNTSRSPPWSRTSSASAS